MTKTEEFEKALKKELEESRKLMESYPELFPLREIHDGTNTRLPRSGFYAGVGWFPIIEDLCNRIHTYCTRMGIAFPIVLQVKEKFGTLRFYVDYADECIHDLVSVAEHESSNVCEQCGAIGATTGGHGLYWIKTLCSLCALKLEK